MSEEESRIETLEDTVENSDKTPDIPEAAEKAEEARKGSKNDSFTSSETHVTNMDTAVEQIVEQTRKGSDKEAALLEAKEKSRNSSAEQAEVLQTGDESRKSLERSPRASETPKESRKSSDDILKVSQTVDEFRKSLERTLRKSIISQESRASTKQQRMSLASPQVIPENAVDKQHTTKTAEGSITIPVAVTPKPSPRPGPSTSKLQEKPVPVTRTGLQRPESLTAIQNHAANFMHRWLNFIPREYRGEMWIYAAGYVFLYSLIMLFRMSTFGFICMIIYTALISLLLLRYFGIGPLVSNRIR